MTVSHSGRIPILCIAPWVDLGGSDKGTIDWFKHIDRTRWAPSLITTQPSPSRWLHHVEPFAEEVWELPDLMPGAMFPRFILGFIESRGVRVIHIMNSRLGFDLLPDMACLEQPPVVVAQMHAAEPDQAGYVRYATRRYGNLIDAFSVTSEHLKQTVAAYQIPPSRIEVIHSGVDGKDEFNPGLVEPFPLAEPGVPRILWPGRLVEQKDPMLSLEALSLVRERGGEFMADVVGDGPMRETVRARAGELGIDELVRWHPPSQEMARWYRTADLTLMTSAFEGIPYVIYESLAMGVPVVAPALPGNVEVVDGDGGALIDPRDDADLYAKAILGLLGNEGGRVKMGERSRARMLAEFSLADMGRRHDELYERLLRARSAGSRWRDDDPLRDGEPGSEASSAVAPPSMSLPRDPAPERTIGVVVPCYRHGIFLDECIESIKGQSLAPASIVVVDDGSDDPETVEALARLDCDADVAVVRQPRNAGPSAARNRGLREIDANYVLFLDADDKLLPDALGQMVAKLEAAPEDIGFVYPHALHFGNRSDYMHLAAYNLWLLIEENYCPSPALFDRRLFGPGGAAYPEEIVVGHEDWDLLLQLAERGIHGLPADGPTFLYRKQGFSRINAVEYGPGSFQETIERRHPLLYGNRDGIKARWAPALSIVLFEEDDTGWTAADLPELAQQTCPDFELLTGTAPDQNVHAVGAADGRPEARLQKAIGEARGRWVCVLTPPAASLLLNPSFVEKLLCGFVAHDGVSAIALGRTSEPNRHALTQLDDRERDAARPVGIAFERPSASALPPIPLEGRSSVLVDLAIELRQHGSVQWRFVSVDDGTAPGGSGESGEPRRRRPAQLDVNHDRSGDRSEVAMRDAVGSLAPRLPGLSAGAVRRWDRSETWMPPGTQPLCRHVELHGEGRIVTNDPSPPPGYALEFRLGATHIHAVPGTARLVATEDGFELSDEQNDLGWGRHGLGYIEQQPIPMLEQLQLCTMPETGELVLIVGVDDPLLPRVRLVERLGWIEPQPILPRRDLLHTGAWGVIELYRQVDSRSGLHSYPVGDEGAEVERSLGFLDNHGGERMVALWRREDGRLATDLTRPTRPSRDPRTIGRWIASPLKGWRRPNVPASATRAVGARARHLARHRHARKQRGGGVALGWLRRESREGFSPLFSATHLVTGDQLVTHTPDEGTNAGYVIDGLLGYARDR